MEALQPWILSMSFIDYLENDSDPIAIFDRASLEHAQQGPHGLLYTNKSLKAATTLCHLVSATFDPGDASIFAPDQQDFQRWLTRKCLVAKDRPGQTEVYDSYLWSVNEIQDRQCLIRGTLLPDRVRAACEALTPDDRGRNLQAKQTLNNFHSTTERSQHWDWDARNAADIPESTDVVPDVSAVRCFMSEPLSAHQAFVRNFDWASTPVGPMSGWNSQLVETVSLTLTGTDPASVFWGTEMTSIYNEAFISIAGQKHPTMMGDSPSNAFAEVWDQFFEPRIQLSRKTKEPFCEKALCLLLERLGYPEETFMTFTFLPLLGYSGEVVGFYHTVMEETQQVLSKRRMSLLLSTSEVLSKAQDLASFWILLIEALTESEYDTPFAILYSVSEETELDFDGFQRGEGIHSPSEPSELIYCHLEGNIGYPPGHEALLDRFSLEERNSSFAPIFRSSMKSRTPTILRSIDGTLPKEIVGNLQKRGFSDQCNAMAVCPLRPTNHDAALGFLVVGLSCRRPVDEDYHSFVNLLVKNISSSMASVVLLEDEKKRGLNNVERAMYEQAQLTARLQERELENQIQEHKFMVMAHQVPVGIFDLTPTGAINFCNHAWYNMTRHNRDDISELSWLRRIHDGDIAFVRNEWITVSVHRKPVSFEARLKTPWQAGSGEDIGPRLDFTWFLARMYPVLADDGSVVNVIGSITDISFQKYAMAQQVQRVEEAIEAKRQQENFIDMTSHEMRNPLNAMLLCAQELSTNLHSMFASDATISTSDKEVLAASIESAETIIYCGRHQKRIIDDVLTLSKLDAKLLQITPIEVQPVTMVQETLKLFESEVRAQGIDVQLEVSESMKQLDVANVLLDPSRVVQILVNFIANAIKFTKTEDIRQMLITIGASKSQPSASELAQAKIQLIPHGGLYQDPTSGTSWGTEDAVYLQFVVRDTGPGISSHDMLRLFGRFTQARPKTHAHYGGSGLGLFISQQLAELQGGRVGIASEPGVGSSFYFYVKAKRTKPVDIAAVATDGQIQGGQPKRRGGQRQKPAEVSRTQPHANATSVLVVEDNLVNQKVLKRQLQQLGYIVAVANHGEEALEVIRESRLWKGEGNNSTSGINPSAPKLHVILMDIEMPVMDGRECIKRIREWERLGWLTTRIPTIALTANARPEQITGAKGFGFDEVISKPFQLTEVVQQISRSVAEGFGHKT